MSKSKRIVGPFVNDFGHIINPGEKAYAVTTCTGRVKVKEVTYVGFVEREVYDWQEKKRMMKKYAQIKTSAKKTEFFAKGTNDKFAWGFFNNNIPGDQQYDRREVSFDQISTLQYNRILPATASLSELASAV